mmetsp:Transcript_137502/g.383496  ORF Transcript_137502/g.383496 Transcript_137502/m.383496 type:complete len:260 (+) Transcript_137502:53-832(+)
MLVSGNNAVPQGPLRVPPTGTSAWQLPPPPRPALLPAVAPGGARAWVPLAAGLATAAVAAGERFRTAVPARMLHYRRSGFLVRPASAAGETAAAAQPPFPSDPGMGALAGQRLRAWLTRNGEDKPRWHYATVARSNGQTAAVEWDAGGQVPLSALKASGGVEWLQQDSALELLQQLEAVRTEDLEQALAGGHDAVLLSLDDMRQEFEELRWLGAQIAARTEEMKGLLEENRDLQKEREHFRKRYEAMLEESEGGLEAAH